jgi:UDP-4-amino-4,6-dideoxy-N-acetyl-beta-L-altrosamine N-acetyltransferase
MEKLHQSYSNDNALINNFIELNDEILLNILAWRNAEEIRKWMYNDSIISEENHLTFCRSLKNNITAGYWLMCLGNKNVGVINLTKYDEINKTGEFGFYLNPQFFKSGLGLNLYYIALELFFNNFKLNNVQGFVKNTNSSALLMNEFFGMKHVRFLDIDNDNYSERVITKEEWKLRNLQLNNINKSFISFIVNKRKISK